MQSARIWMLPLAMTLLSPNLSLAQDPEVNGKRASEWRAMLEKDSLVRKRKAAAIALGAIGTKYPGTVPALQTALLRDSDAGVRSLILNNLNLFTADELRLFLAELAVTLKEDKEPVNRETAARLIGKLGDQAVPAAAQLVAALGDTAAGVRAAAAEAIGKTGPDGRNLAPKLLPLFTDSQSSVRVEAVRAVGRLGIDGESLLPKLREILAKDSVVEVRREAVRTCLAANLPAEQIVPLLISTLSEDDNADNRVEVLRVLERVNGDPNIILPIVRRRLVDKQEKERFVRVQLVRFLALMEKRDMPALIKDLIAVFKSEEDTDIRVAVVQELGELTAHSQAVLPILQEASSDFQKPVRDAAKSALTRLIGPMKE